MTYTLPNYFNTLLDPNASNNPSLPHVPTQYFNKDRSSNQPQKQPQGQPQNQLSQTQAQHTSSAIGKAFKTEIEQMDEYVIEEFKKVKISLSAFELLKVPTVRHSFFRFINGTPYSKATPEIPTKRVSFKDPQSEPIIQKIHGKKSDPPHN